ncbi:uncharacterized protein [Mycetomoellerius zeteki]|uniref:uncharacterized protein n=1 Tax=Mycetomoellerius zeteki TaxID=64791 RepID=UPI00084ECE2A|nr:PREDICTED: uncharacterized protein LOC108726620 [Trachymyrmex zeteki]
MHLIRIEKRSLGRLLDGLVNPCKELSPTSSTISCSDVRNLQRKRKRVEHILEELVENIAAEKEEKREERKRRETKHKEIREKIDKIAREDIRSKWMFKNL